jgi:glycosyltransferase involved in cell wall biosynthesis
MITNRTALLGNDPIIPAVCQGPGEPGLVSVIISTYNRGYCIGKTIDSVLAQTYRPLEIVVVDDGSSDATRSVVEKYGSAIRYLYQDNAGLAVARNTGLAAAKGEFIAFQDSDDIWLPWKLHVQVALMRHRPELALVWTDMVAVDDDGAVVREKHLSTMYSVYRRIPIAEYLSNVGRIQEFCPDCPDELRQLPFRYGDIYGAMFFGNLVHPPTALIRRKHIEQTGGLDVTFAWTCEDYEFFWRIAKHGPGALVDASSILYRVDAVDQLTKPHLRLYIARGNLIAVQRRYRECLDEIKLPRNAVNHHVASAHEWVALEELESASGSRTKAVQHLCRSMVLDPLQRRPYARMLGFFFLPKAVVSFIRSMTRRVSSRAPRS